MPVLTAGTVTSDCEFLVGCDGVVGSLLSPWRSTTRCWWQEVSYCEGQGGARTGEGGGGSGMGLGLGGMGG